MNKNIRDKLFLIFLIGLFIRLVFMVYISHCANVENINLVEQLYKYGLFLDPLLNVISYHTGFYLVFWPVYIPYMILNYFGIYYSFLLNFLIKMPSLIADIIIFCSLYNITKFFTNDKGKSLSIAAIFFLNPYSIYLTSIISHPTSVISAFILLSFLYLFKGKISYSAVFLALSTSIQLLPIFLLPCFIAYLWKSNKVDSEIQIEGKIFFQFTRGRLSSPALHFLKMFLISCLVLFSPYFIVSGTLYLNDPRLFWYYVNIFIHPVRSIPKIPGETSAPALVGMSFNFTGLFNELGISSYLAPYLGYTLLFPLYFTFSVITLKQVPLKTYGRAHLLNRFVILFFSLFVIAIPLCQSHYLGWFFPFIVLEALLFSGLPNYYPVLLSVLHFLIDPISGYSYRWYFVETFPELFLDRWTASGNILLDLSLSATYCLFLILSVFKCLIAKNTLSTSKLRYHMPKGFGQRFILLFSIFSILEIMRISRGFEFRGMFLFNALIGFLALVWFLKYLNKDSVGISKHKFLSNWASKIVVLVHIFSLVGIFLVVNFIQFDTSIFLLVQMLILGSLWLTNRSFTFGQNVEVLSFIFTPIYIFIHLSSTKNILVGLFTLVYVTSWLYLQIITEADKGNED